MAQKIYVVEGRKFRTEADYQNALKDQQVIENLRVQTKKMSLADQKKLLEVIRSGRCRFHSIPVSYTHLDVYKRQAMI